MRNFGLPSETTRLMSGEQPSAGPRNVAYSTRDDSNVIQLATRVPSLRGSWPDSRGFGRGLFLQRVIDFTTLCFAIFFVCSLACSVPLAIFLMFFAKY